MAAGFQDRDLGLLRKRLIRGLVMTLFLDEPPVEVGETQKSLEFLDVGRNCPGCNGLHLPLIHPDDTTIDVVSQELH